MQAWSSGRVVSLLMPLFKLALHLFVASQVSGHVGVHTLLDELIQFFDLCQVVGQRQTVVD